MFFRKKTQPPETPAFTVNSNLAATAAPLVVASPEAKPEERSYHAVEVNNFNRDFLADAIRTNEDIRRNGERLRRLSREMAKNGGDYRKFLKMCERNIVGPNGFQIQAKISFANGNADERACRYVESLWNEFSERGNCTANRRHTMRKFLKMVVRCWKIDGEVFIRRLPHFNNRFGYALQLLDPEACPMELNMELPDGNRIVTGVELDEWDAPVAYWFRKRARIDQSMGEYFDPVWAPGEPDGEAYVRLGVDEVNHFFDDELPNQIRGIPFGQAALQNIHLLNSYIYTELAAADAASRKLGMIINKQMPSSYGGRERNPDGTKAPPPKQEVHTERASMDVVTGEWDIKMCDPQHPATNFPPFVNALQRNIANGLDVAYPTFANDLRDVNFSSIRAGLLDERDSWKDQQEQIVEDILTEEFRRFLAVQLLRPGCPYTPGAYRRLCNVEWLPRKWQWVDPVKDAQSNLMQLAMGATTPQDIAADLGNNFNDNVQKIAEAAGGVKPIREMIYNAGIIQQAFDKKQKEEPEDGSSFQFLARSSLRNLQR